MFVTNDPKLEIGAVGDSVELRFNDANHSVLKMSSDIARWIAKELLRAADYVDSGK